MGILRYIVQGIGWEVGRTAAREGLDKLREGEQPAEQAALPPPSKRELARLEKERRKAEAKKQAEIEAELARLKKQK